MSLFAYGSIHQGHGRFSGKSHGKQCAFMSLLAGEIQNVYICWCALNIVLADILVEYKNIINQYKNNVNACAKKVFVHLSKSGKA